MEKISAILAFAFICTATCFVTTFAVDRCLCPVMHPQQKFCDSDFAFVATVRGSEKVDDYLIYDMKVSLGKVYKGEELIDRGRSHIQVFTTYDGFLCGRPNLVYLKKYLITGVMKNGHMEMSYCDWISDWEDLSPDQVRYLKKGIYGRQCESCSVKGVYSAHSNDMNSNANTFHESQLSGMWSRHHCTYNPIASAMIAEDDCENLHSYCTRDVTTGGCHWKANESYGECFNMREAIWAIKHPQLPVFTHVRQCRELRNRRVKKKCLRAVRNYFRTVGRNGVDELPVPL